MYAVKLFNNYTVACCGERQHTELLTMWTFNTLEDAYNFYAKHKSTYNKKTQLGQWLDEPEEIKDGY